MQRVRLAICNVWLFLAASSEHRSRSRKDGEIGSGQTQTTMCSRRAGRVSVLFCDLKPYRTSHSELSPPPRPLRNPILLPYGSALERSCAAFADKPYIVYCARAAQYRTAIALRWPVSSRLARGGSSASNMRVSRAISRPRPIIP